MTLEHINQRTSAPRQRRFTAVDLFLLVLLLVMASYLDKYVFSIGGPPPLVFQVFSVVCFVGVFLARAALGAQIWSERSDRVKTLIIAILCMVVWTLFAYAYGSQSEIASTLLIDRLKGSLFLIVFAIFLDHPQNQRPFYLGCAALTCVSALLNIQDFISPAFTTVPGRAAGLYMNPNISGFMLVSLGALSLRGLGLVPRYLIWACVCVGVMLTFSRASWLYLVLATVALSWFGYFGFGRLRYAFATSLLLVLGILAWALISGALYQIVVDSPFASSLDVNTLGRIGSSGAMFDDFAADERREVLNLGLERFQSSPFFGYGLGSTHEWEARVSTHNMYVLFLAEGGILGIAVYCSFLGLLLHRSRDVGWMLCLILVLAGFSSHNLLDTAGEVAVLAAIIAFGASKPRTASK